MSELSLLDPFRFRGAFAGAHSADARSCKGIWAYGGFSAALESRTTARGHALGARWASAGTQLWNAPAHATYAKFGFTPHRILTGRTKDLGADEG